MGGIRLNIDDIEVEAEKGQTILEAAVHADIYIPTLCAHPDLPPAPGITSRKTIFRGGKAVRGTKDIHEFEGCRLCIVVIEGREGTYTACDTPAVNGMVVNTNTPGLRRLRQENFAGILINHPHTCLTCAQKEGCSLIQCSVGVPEEERCCPNFNTCELRKIAEYVGIKEDISRYIPRNLPIVGYEPLLSLNYNLCIGCLRCVRACQDFQNIGALGYVYYDSEFVVGTVARSLKESNCNFCGACIEVCPSGALSDKSDKARAVRTGKLKISLPILPPTVFLIFETQSIASVPEIEGVYQLLDEQKNIIYIKGTMNLRRELEHQMETNGEARYYEWEDAPMYTQRETELIQKFLQTHNRLPIQNDELADLL